MPSVREWTIIGIRSVQLDAHAVLEQIRIDKKSLLKYLTYDIIRASFL